MFHNIFSKLSDSLGDFSKIIYFPLLHIVVCKIQSIGEKQAELCFNVHFCNLEEKE